MHNVNVNAFNFGSKFYFPDCKVLHRSVFWYHLDTSWGNTASSFYFCKYKFLLLKKVLQIIPFKRLHKGTHCLFFLVLLISVVAFEMLTTGPLNNGATLNLRRENDRSGCKVASAHPHSPIQPRCLLQQACYGDRCEPIARPHANSRIRISIMSFTRAE